MGASARDKDRFVIAQFSDIHVGESRFDEGMLLRVIEEINEAEPDMVVVPGDLTANGYRDEFERAKEYIDRLECRNVIVIAGNHDCRHVGYLHFEDIFGRRYHERSYEFGVRDDGEMQRRMKVLAADSNKPDLDAGELGRDKYDWIAEEYSHGRDFKVFILHHHVVSIPGTGRERNILLDAGDVLEALSKAEVDLVLAGHKHVPWAWPISCMLIVTSGTAATWRTRGHIPPSYNMITLGADEIAVDIRDLREDRHTLLRFARGDKCPLRISDAADG